MTLSGRHGFSRKRIKGQCIVLTPEADGTQRPPQKHAVLFAGKCEQWGDLMLATAARRGDRRNLSL